MKLITHFGHRMKMMNILNIKVICILEILRNSGRHILDYQTIRLNPRHNLFLLVKVVVNRLTFQEK